jgi:SNF2 family DNA or RNA helicase
LPLPRHPTLQVAGRYEIAVATYDTVTKAPFSAAVAEVPWHAVFFDEAHFLKNQKTSRYAAADALPTRMRFGLTGAFCLLSGTFWVSFRLCPTISS